MRRYLLRGWVLFIVLLCGCFFATGAFMTDVGTQASFPLHEDDKDLGSLFKAMDDVLADDTDSDLPAERVTTQSVAVQTDRKQQQSGSLDKRAWMLAGGSIAAFLMNRLYFKKQLVRLRARLKLVEQRLFHRQEDGGLQSQTRLSLPAYKAIYRRYLLMRAFSGMCSGVQWGGGIISLLTFARVLMRGK